MTESWDITSDSDLRDAIRDETHYTDDRLPQTNTDGPDLDGVVESAKRVLALRAGVTDFYSERGLAVALLGIACAKAKGAVENSPVRVKNIGAEDVTMRTSDGTSLQVQSYEEMVMLGLAEASSTDAGTKDIVFTNTFYHD